MNLETVEQRCLKYLAQAKRICVPIEALLEYVRRDSDCTEVSRSDLLDFLRRHELFKVIDPVVPDGDRAENGRLEEMGFSLRPQVMLSTREPSAGELAALMREQVDKMVDALSAALAEAQMAGEAEHTREVARILHLARQLRERFGQFL